MARLSSIRRFYSPRKTFFNLVFYCFISLSLFICIGTESASAIDIKSSDIKIYNRLSNKFSNKFCNAIGFGLSSDSALKFSVGENKKERSKKNKIIDLDTDYLSEQISTEIVENCGYNIGYEGFEGINKFKEYILKNKVIDSFK